MKRFSDFTRSSVGKKQIMALTGLALSLFLVGHLSGNFLLFVGPEKFNAYANFMSAHPLLIPVELVLLLIFLSHVGFAIALTRQNRAARPVAYAVNDASDASLASRTMILTGLVVFAFVPIHLINFKYQNWHETEAGLYGLVVAKFADPLYAIPYIVAMIILGFHLWHALHSLIRTFGLVHPTYTPILKKICAALAIILAGGFTSIPVWFLLFGQGGN